MSSPAANRANAKLSTGPRTPEGKAASSRNALKHGIHANALIIPGEDPDTLTQLTADYHDQLKPKGELEIELVQVIVRSTWLQRRLALIETQVMNSRLAALEPSDTPLGDMFIQDCEGPRALDKIFRRQQTLQRDFFRALNELRRLQEQRAQAAMSAMEADLSSPGDADWLRSELPEIPPGPTPAPPRRTPDDNPALRL